MVARGQKGYNGVAILSKFPLEDAGGLDLAQLGHARHVAGRLPNGVTIHNHYVPAGGDVPDREKMRNSDKNSITSLSCEIFLRRKNHSGRSWWEI